jgi:Tfp pilus assembly protein PilX
MPIRRLDHTVHWHADCLQQRRRGRTKAAQRWWALLRWAARRIGELRRAACRAAERSISDGRHQTAAPDANAHSDGLLQRGARYRRATSSCSTALRVPSTEIYRSYKIWSHWSLSAFTVPTMGKITFFVGFSVKTSNSPRQARDQHEEGGKQWSVFPQTTMGGQWQGLRTKLKRCPRPATLYTVRRPSYPQLSRRASQRTTALTIDCDRAVACAAAAAAAAGCWLLLSTVELTRWQCFYVQITRSLSMGLQRIGTPSREKSSSHTTSLRSAQQKQHSESAS